MIKKIGFLKLITIFLLFCFLWTLAFAGGDKGDDFLGFLGKIVGAVLVIAAVVSGIGAIVAAIQAGNLIGAAFAMYETYNKVQQGIAIYNNGVVGLVTAAINQFANGFIDELLAPVEDMIGGYLNDIAGSVDDWLGDSFGDSLDIANTFKPNIDVNIGSDGKISFDFDVGHKVEGSFSDSLNFPDFSDIDTGANIPIPDFGNVQLPTILFNSNLPNLGDTGINFGTQLINIPGISVPNTKLELPNLDLGDLFGDNEKRERISQDLPSSSKNVNVELPDYFDSTGGLKFKPGINFGHEGIYTWQSFWGWGYDQARRRSGKEAAPWDIQIKGDGKYKVFILPINAFYNTIKAKHYKTYGIVIIRPDGTPVRACESITKQELIDYDKPGYNPALEEYHLYVTHINRSKDTPSGLILQNARTPFSENVFINEPKSQCPMPNIQELNLNSEYLYFMDRKLKDVTLLKDGSTIPSVFSVGSLKRYKDIKLIVTDCSLYYREKGSRVIYLTEEEKTRIYSKRYYDSVNNSWKTKYLFDYKNIDEQSGTAEVYTNRNGSKYIKLYWKVKGGPKKIFQETHNYENSMTKTISWKGICNVDYKHEGVQYFGKAAPPMAYLTHLEGIMPDETKTISKTKMIYVNPSWQGGTDLGLDTMYNGTLEDVYYEIYNRRLEYDRRHETLFQSRLAKAQKELKKRQQQYALNTGNEVGFMELYPNGVYDIYAFITVEAKPDAKKGWETIKVFLQKGTFDNLNKNSSYNDSIIAQATKEINILGFDYTKSSFEISPSSVIEPNTGKAKVTVTIKDHAGAPMPNMQVKFISQRNYETKQKLDTTPDPDQIFNTNNEGKVSFMLSSDKQGTTNIVALVEMVPIGKKPVSFYNGPIYFKNDLGFILSGPGDETRVMGKFYDKFDNILPSLQAKLTITRPSDVFLYREDILTPNIVKSRDDGYIEFYFTTWVESTLTINVELVK